MESTPLIVDDPNCWNDRYSQKSYPNLNCGDILLVTNRAVQGIPNENFEEFVLAYEYCITNVKQCQGFCLTNIPTFPNNPSPF